LSLGEDDNPEYSKKEWPSGKYYYSDDNYFFKNNEIFKNSKNFINSVPVIDFKTHTWVYLNKKSLFKKKKLNYLKNYIFKLNSINWVNNVRTTSRSTFNLGVDSKKDYQQFGLYLKKKIRKLRKFKTFR